jgi:hypothetical protein
MNPASVVIRRIALAALAAAAMSLAGCESAQEAADQPAQEQYTQAVQNLGQDRLAAALTAADAAGAMPGISPEMAWKVHTLQGELRTTFAQQGLNQAQEMELNISRLLAQLRLATMHVQAAQSQMKSDQDYDPATVEDQLRAKIAQATGVAGQADASGQLSLAGIDAQTASLQAAIADNRQQAESAAQKKTQMAEQADQLQQKSLGESGQDAVDDVTSAAEARRQAAEAGIAIGKLDAALVNLKGDLVLKTAQRAGVQKAIDGFNQQIADLDVAWKSVQQDIEAQKNAIALLAGPSPDSAAAPAADESSDLPQMPSKASTIADQCVQLKTLVAQARDLRDKAALQFQQAIRNYTGAAGAGDQLRTALAHDALDPHATPGEKDAFAQLLEAYSAASGRLAVADTERTLATNNAAEAMIAIQAKEALTAAQAVLGAQAPAAVADCLTALASPSVEDLAQTSEDSYKSAMDHYDNLMVQTLPGPAAASRKTAAMVGKMIASFGAKQLSLAQDSKPIAGQTPKELQSSINDLAKQVAEADATRLPAIPYTITPDAPAAQ